MAEHLNFSQYAARRGWKQPYISQLVREGVIPVTEDRKIDPDVADAAIAQHRDLSKQGVTDRHAANRAATGQPAAPPLPQQSPSQPEAPVGQYHRAKTANEVFRAKSAQLEYERAVGKLVEADRITAGIADGLGPIVTRLEGLAARVAPKIVGQTDVRRVLDVLDDEILTIRQEIADTLRAIIASGDATKQ